VQFSFRQSPFKTVFKNGFEIDALVWRSTVFAVIFIWAESFSIQLGSRFQPGSEFVFHLGLFSHMDNAGLPSAMPATQGEYEQKD
jgi:hypothetical protein